VKYLMVLILIFSQGCTGLLIYELINSSEVMEDSENVPMVNVKYYYDKPDKKTTGKEQKDGLLNQAD